MYEATFGPSQHVLQIHLNVFDVQLLKKLEAAKYQQPAGYLTQQSVIPISVSRSVSLSFNPPLGQSAMITCLSFSGSKDDAQSTGPLECVQTERSNLKQF